VRLCGVSSGKGWPGLLAAIRNFLLRIFFNLSDLSIGTCIAVSIAKVSFANTEIKFAAK